MTYSLKVIQDGYETFDQRVRDTIALAREQGHTIPCGRGCSACCYDVALVTQYEMAPLMDAVRKMPKAEQSAIKLALVTWCGLLTQKGISLNDAEPSLAVYHAHPKLACPFLDTVKGECKVYDARPPACRGHVIIDQEAAVCANRENVPAVQNLVLSDEISRLMSYTIGHSVAPNRKDGVPIAIYMLPAMMLRAWVLVERPELTYPEWFDAIERSATGRTELPLP